MQTIEPISTKELRDNLSEILEQVAIGKRSFAVYKFGKKKAILSAPVQTIPSKTKKRDLASHPAVGMWKDREDMKDPVKWVREMREKESRRTKIFK